MKFWSEMFERSLLLLVAVTVAALLGHICALPAEAESAAGTTAGAEPHHADTVHVDAASCDATLSKTAPARLTSPAIALTIPSPAIADLTPGPWRQAITQPAVASRRVPDRSLFLLNASFLI